jgi:CRP-like cAMP-binding protein
VAWSRGTSSAISLIDGGPRTATVTAREPITALVIDRAGFDRLMDDWPVVRLELVSALTQRLRTTAPAVSD